MRRAHVHAVGKDDDRPEIFRARLREQLPPMYEVSAYYDERGLLSQVDGRLTIDAVTAAIAEVIGDVDSSGDKPTGNG